jgi:hypothetical protein
MKLFGKATIDFVPNTQVSKSAKDLDAERREASADLRKRSNNRVDTEDQQARLKNARDARGQRN